jgi:ferredoxin
MLDYTDDNCRPLKDIYRNPSAFKFFSPQVEGLELPKGIILNSGRATLSKNPQRIQFATSTFNSGNLDKRHIHKEGFAPPAMQEASGSYDAAFNNARQTVVADGSHSLLDIAESQGIKMAYGCCTGGRGECKVTVSKG